MLNIFEQPWLFIIAAIAALITVYIIILDRKIYWLSWLTMVFLIALYLMTKSTILTLSPSVQTLLKILLPVVIILLIIFIIISIIRSGEKGSWFWLGPIALCLFGIGLDLLITTDSEQIKKAINTCQKAFKQQNIKLIAPFISDKYQDSIHENKQDLLQHCSSFLEKILFSNITRLSTQIQKTDNIATATIVVFISFDPRSFVAESYGTFSAKVAARITLKKEPDKIWRIQKTEIIEVDNQPTSWNKIDI